MKLPPDPEARRLAEAFRLANRSVCDRSLSFQDHAAATASCVAVRDEVLRASAYGQIDRFVFKRSWPFGSPRERYSPDLWDLEDQFPDSLHVVIHRDPRAATYSALRRGFDTDLRRIAVVCAEQLTRLAAQVSALPADRVHIVSYETLCANPGPVLGPLADFCELARDDVIAAAGREGLDRFANGRFRDELGAEAAWLEGFFDPRRRRQWSVLEA